MTTRALSLPAEQKILNLDKILKALPSSPEVLAAQVELHDMVSLFRSEAHGTPAAAWRERKEEDPHDVRYVNIERSKLAGGQYTDDEVANKVYLNPGIVNLTIAKDRIRWLSRKLDTTTKQLSDLREFAEKAIKTY